MLPCVLSECAVQLVCGVSCVCVLLCPSCAVSEIVFVLYCRVVLLLCILAVASCGVLNILKH